VTLMLAYIGRGIMARKLSDIRFRHGIITCDISD